MKRKFLLLLLLSSVFLFPANGKSKKIKEVSVPGFIHSAKGKADFRCIHYWDRYDFRNISYKYLHETAEPGIINYIKGFPSVEKDIIRKSIFNVLEKCEEEKSGRVYRFFTEKLRERLYRSESPQYDEEYYIPVAEYMLNKARVKPDPAEKERLQFELTMMEKNRTGSVAGDFQFMTGNDKKGHLYGIQSEYILLFFYSPDCDLCLQKIKDLSSDSLINAYSLSGRLKILACYPDSDRSVWEKGKESIPETWINAYDFSGQINRKLTYFIRTPSSFYLLDKGKKVILKNTTLCKIDDWLKDHRLS